LVAEIAENFEKSFSTHNSETPRKAFHRKGRKELPQSSQWDPWMLNEAQVPLADFAIP